MDSKERLVAKRAFFVLHPPSKVKAGWFSIEITYLYVLVFVFQPKKTKKVQPKLFIHPMKKEPKQQVQKTTKNEKTSKQLLGELYTDKEYLKKLLKDEGVCVCVEL